MLRFIYTTFIHLYNLFSSLFGLFNEKAKFWSEGRKGLLEKIENELLPFSGKTIWIHSASLGEFEQGKPIIEAIKKNDPKIRIIVTFFSPSGYEIQKDYHLADHVFYLPTDTIKNARYFISLIKPDMAIFIKYEFWYNYLNELQQAHIPYIFISAIFRPNQVFFNWYGKWFLKHLKNSNHFFVQNERSRVLLENVGISEVSVTGDTRFDRVLSIAQQVKQNSIIEKFKDNSRLFIVGSSWPKDEEFVQKLSLQYPDLKLIIAPHLIDKSHIEQIEKLFPKALKYSNATLENIIDTHVLIIDNIGLLSSLYQYADYALIGGGFGVGIHNTLEAATFGMPIFIGPNYQKFQEAVSLIEEKVIYVFEDSEQLIKSFDLFWNDEDQRLRVKNAAVNYVVSNSGASAKILNFISLY